MKKFNSRLTLSPAESERARAIVIAPVLIETADQLEPVLAKLKKQKRKYSHVAKTVKETALQIAENFAQQGFFDKAAENSPDKKTKEFYSKIFEAVWKNDSECECEPPKEAIGGKLLTMPKHRILKQVFSLKHNQTMYLLECVVCESWNVRNLTEDLIRIAQEQSKPEDKRRNDIQLFGK